MNKKVFKDTITLYTYYKHAVTGNETFKRTILDYVFWNETSIRQFKNTGIESLRDVTVYIPLKLFNSKNNDRVKYIDPVKWSELPIETIKNYYTLDTTKTNYIVKDLVDFEFHLGTPAEISKQRGQFIASVPQYRIVKEVNAQFFGSEDKHHIELRC